METRTAARMILATLATHALWFANPQIYGGRNDLDRAADTTIEMLIQALGPVSSPMLPSEPLPLP